MMDIFQVVPKAWLSQMRTTGLCKLAIWVLKYLALLLKKKKRQKLVLPIFLAVFHPKRTRCEKYIAKCLFLLCEFARNYMFIAQDWHWSALWFAPTSPPEDNTEWDIASPDPSWGVSISRVVFVSRKESLQLLHIHTLIVNLYKYISKTYNPSTRILDLLLGEYWKSW